MTPLQTRLAVLIDGDNIGHPMIANLCKEIAALGKPQIQRVYRDWSRTPDWKDVLLKYALQPMHQFGYVQGKNATDIAMVIDALELAQTGLYDGFCLASSDSDFTPLVIRLRQRSLKVYGLGEKKTPPAFQQACDRFVFLPSPGEKKPSTAA
jgi:uncharacterized LabA/DUF88 family protein